MKVVTTAGNEQTAAMIQDKLKNEGITSYLENQGTSDVFSGLAFADIPIMVADEDYEKALAVVKQYREDNGEE